jgi:hypothetical protein
MWLLWASSCIEAILLATDLDFFKQDHAQQSKFVSVGMSEYHQLVLLPPQARMECVCWVVLYF